MFADLIESEKRLCTISMSEIDALMPVAFGSSLLIRDSIRDAMIDSAAKELPPRRTSVDAAAMSALDFLVICERVVREPEKSLRREQL
jgi:hypothetical protein